MKRQGQIVAATIKNFDAAEEALVNMADSVGSAEAELATYQESAEYLANQFKETFTSIAQNAVERDDLKDLIKFGTSMLEIVDGIVGKIGLIPAILSTIVGITASKKMTKGGIFGLNEEGKLTAFGAQVGKGWWGNATGNTQRIEIQKNVQAVKEFHTALKNGDMTMEKYNAVMKNSNAEIKRYGRAALKAGDDTSVYRTTVKNLNADLKSVGKNGKLAGVGAKAAAIGVRALNVAASMLISMGVSAAIQTIISALDKAINSVKNHVSKLDELGEEMKSLESEISDVNGKLSETKLKINELEKLPKLTFLEKEELEELKRYNDELERQKQIMKNEAEADKNAVNKEAQNLWHEMNNSALTKSMFEREWWEWLLGGVRPAIDLVKDFNNAVNDNNWKDQIDNLEQYKQLLKTLNNIKASDEYKNDPEEFKDLVKAEEKKLEELGSKIVSHYGVWNKLIAGLNPDDPKNKDIIETIQKAIDDWDILSGKIETTFTGIYNAPQFATVKQYLDDLAQKGELTAEKFDSLTEREIEGIDRFKEALKNVKDLTVDDVIESIVKEANNLDDAANKEEKSINSYTQSLEKLYETLDKIIGKQEKLSEAFNKIRLGSSLTAKEVYELSKEMPDIFKYLEPTSDGGYTLSTDGFNALSNENIDAEKDKLQKSISETKTQIALLGSLQKAALEVENSGGKDKGLVDHFAQLSEATEELRESLGIESMGQIGDGLAELQEKLKEDELYFDVLTSAFDKSSADFYDDAKSKISEFNNELKAFDSAVKTLNEGNTLSYNEMVEIVELAPELQDFFDEMNGRYTIAADKITEWREKSFEARNEYIQGLIEQAKAELQTAQDSKKAAEVILNIQNKFGSATEQLAAQIDLDTAEKKIKDILDVIEKYEALMGDIADADDSGQKLTDELQNKIDYYKTILDAIDIVKDKYTEALDNEIDALEESKDALKEANDERQRELDLIEKRNNLENAKKRKVYVYSEGEGFKQVQDEKAVKEAEEEYRDAINSVQEAEIDKAIAEKEKQKEALEKSLEDLLNSEQDIQDAIAIAKAVKSLGLSSPADLLNLSDDVKQGIIDGLADSTLQKDREDNKDNDKYTDVTLDSILSYLGSDKKASDIPQSLFDNISQSAYNSALKGFTDALKSDRENMVKNVSYNNSPVVNANFVINDASDPEKIGEVVEMHIRDLLQECSNSIK